MSQNYEIVKKKDKPCACGLANIVSSFDTLRRGGKYAMFETRGSNFSQRDRKSGL